MLDVTVNGPTGVITLNRPERRNAMSAAMWVGLGGAVRELAQRDEVRVVVVRGAGGHFAAGADISEFERVYGTREAATDYAAQMAGAMDALLACPKPVIAAINGYCIGGGVAMILCCDLCFADSGAQFAITPARLGLAYSFADTRRLAGRVGAAGARDLLFSARRINAMEALRLGLIDRVCEGGTLDEAVAAYAALVSENSAATVRVAKNFVARAVAGQVSEDAATIAAYLDILEGPDFAEGRGAFLARRAPKFN